MESLLDLGLFRIVSLFKNKSCMCSFVSISRVLGEVRVMEVGVIGLWPRAFFKKGKYLVKGPVTMFSLLLGHLLLEIVLGQEVEGSVGWPADGLKDEW